MITERKNTMNFEEYDFEQANASTDPTNANLIFPPFWGPHPPFWGPQPPFWNPRPPMWGPQPPFHPGRPPFPPGRPRPY